MSHIKHTPGPWKVLRGHTRSTWFVIYKTRETKQRSEAATVYKGLHLVKSGDVEAPALASVDSLRLNHSANKETNEAEALANARLISAAPELLKLADTLVRMTVNSIDPEDFSSIRAEALAVIAKATEG